MPEVDEAVRQLRTVEARMRALYGQLAAPPSGVIHTVAAVRATTGRLHVINIQEGAPKSDTDAFVLDLWRAHCDAIVTTGQVLRAEPGLSYAQRGPLALGLKRFRQQVLGKPVRVRCAVLTHGVDLPLTHPVFGDQAEVELVVLTHPHRAMPLRRRLGDHVSVIGVPGLDGRRVLEVLREAGAAAIGVEAGPSVVSSLYLPTPMVDHLMLSICEAPVGAGVVGGALPEAAALFAGLTRISDVACREESGTWRFQHWTRLAGAVHNP